jgi:hypothetical protein
MRVRIPRMASRKKNPSKAKRYSVKEKEEILRYVDSVNSKQGRGGQTAAVKKYGISALTISTWLRGGGASFKAGKVSSNGTGGVIAKLAAVHAEIVAKEKELVTLRSQFEKLKSSI